MVVLVLLCLACSNGYVATDAQREEPAEKKQLVSPSESPTLPANAGITSSNTGTPPVLEKATVVEQQPSSAINEPEKAIFTPGFTGEFEFQLASGTQINQSDILTGRPVFMVSVSEY